MIPQLNDPIVYQHMLNADGITTEQVVKEPENKIQDIEVKTEAIPTDTKKYNKYLVGGITALLLGAALYLVVDMVKTN